MVFVTVVHDPGPLHFSNRLISQPKPMTDPLRIQPRIPGIRFTHSPGPTRVPDDVLHAMQRPMTDLADPRVAANIAACEQGMRRLLRARDADVFLYASNGHGLWEAVAVNLATPGRCFLIGGTGHFSDHWALQTTGLGLEVQRTPHREGYPVDVAAIEQALRDDKEHRISAVLVVHTDTASGVTSDLAAVRRAIDAARHPALYVVDIVASLAASQFDFDALGVDVAMGGSQKGLMLPPGLGFAAVGAKAMRWAQDHPGPRFYWDWVRRKTDNQSAKFCGTPPLAHLAGLEVAIALIEREGLDAVIARHARLATTVHTAVRRWASKGAVRLHCQVPSALSNSVTAIELSAGHDAEALRATARERFQVAMAGGLGPLAGRVFRIGHLGDMNEPMVLGALAGIEAAMTVRGIPYGTDGVAAAVAYLAGL